MTNALWLLPNYSFLALSEIAILASIFCTGLIGTADERTCSLIMFRKADFLDPVFIVLALVCLLLTLMAWTASDRLIAFEDRRASYNPSLPWHPPPQDLLVELNGILGQDVPELRSIFLPNRVPASGIIEVLEYGNMYVAILRDDIDSMYVDLQAVSMPILVVISGNKQIIEEKVVQYKIRGE